MMQRFRLMIKSYVIKNYKQIANRELLFNFKLTRQR